MIAESLNDLRRFLWFTLTCPPSMAVDNWIAVKESVELAEAARLYSGQPVLTTEDEGLIFGVKYRIRAILTEDSQGNPILDYDENGEPLASQDGDDMSDG